VQNRTYILNQLHGGLMHLAYGWLTYVCEFAKMTLFPKTIWGLIR